MALWSRVLTSVPGSRLVLKASKSLSIPEVCADYLNQFEACGIARERITLLPKASWAPGEVNQHLAAYAMVDIALDTFPYGGTTTTVEAMMQGVPVVSLQVSNGR